MAHPGPSPATHIPCSTTLCSCRFASFSLLALFHMTVLHLDAKRYKSILFCFMATFLFICVGFVFFVAYWIFANVNHINSKQSTRVHYRNEAPPLEDAHMIRLRLCTSAAFLILSVVLFSVSLGLLRAKVCFRG